MIGKLKVEMQGIDKVKTMIDLLDKYKEDLPKELLKSLKDASDCDSCEFGADQLKSMGVSHGSVSCECDGEIVSGVVSANTILKRLTVYPARWDGTSDRPESTADGFIEAHKYPKQFSMKDSAGNLVMGWG